MITWVAPISAFIYKWDYKTLIVHFILCIDPSQLWFLWMLFFVFALIWPLRRVLMDRLYLGFFFSGLLFFLGIICDHFFPNVFCIWTAFRYVFFFQIGMQLWNEDSPISKLANHPICLVLIDIALFITLMNIDLKQGIVWSFFNYGLTFVLNFIGSLMAWCLLQRIASIVNWSNSNRFRVLSSYSMPMYLFHQQFVYFPILWLNGKINPLMNAFLCFVFAFLCSYLVSALLMNWGKTRFLIGEK